MLAAEQARRGWSVLIALRRTGGVYTELLKNSGVEIHELGDFRNLNPYLILRIRALIDEVRPDLVQTWLPQMDVAGGVAALMSEVPFVLTERVSKLAFGSFNLMFWLRKYVGRSAQAVVANSSAGVCYWQGMLPKITLLKKIPNAVDVVAIRNAAPVFTEFNQSCPKVILVVGRLSHQKAVEVVLQAISLLTDRRRIKFIVVGDGPLRQKLEALIDDLKIGDSVVMLPFQLGWWGLLQGASALVSMSRYEGNPNVVLEAMAAGCPLIVSDIPEHREILTDDSANFVLSEDPIQLAAAIERLLYDPGSGLKKSDRAKNYVNGLTIQVAADSYEEVYANVMRGKVRS
jgi:glycosyltransferase involved in cell wall biosynthesis